MNIDKLDDIVNKCNNIYHCKIKAHIMILIRKIVKYKK